MNKSKAVFRLTLVASALVALCYVRPAMAGTTNSYIKINGYGAAYVSGTFVNSNGVAAGAAANSTFASTNIYLPCASVNPKSFTCNVTNSSSPLPSNKPPSTNYIQVSGTSKGTWINNHYITAGSSVDNPKFDERLFINPAPCSSFSMDSTMTTNNDGLSGVIIIQAKSDAGSGLWVRGIEYAQTATNADELIAHGSLK